MSRNNVPPYEIITYPIEPPIGGKRFGAKPIVASGYRIQPDAPWNKEFWGKTEEEAVASAQTAIDEWARGRT